MVSEKDVDPGQEACHLLRYTVNLDLRVLTAPLSLRSSVTPVGHLHPSFLTVRTSLVPRSVTPVGKDERSEDDPREKERVE